MYNGKDTLGKRIELELMMKLNDSSRLSDWSATELLQIQIDHAASRSMALVDLYHLNSN